MPEGQTAGRGWRWDQRLEDLPRWLSALLIAVLLVACWALVRAAGGSRTAVPHVFYVPIVLAALPFGIPGGLLAGLAATLLSGPFMPLDTALGEAQEVLNWVARAPFFLGVGALSGATTRAMRRSFESDLTAKLQDEIDLVAPTRPEQPGPGWQDRVATMLSEPTLRTVFQPIYGLADGKLIAVEALTQFEPEPMSPPDVWFDQAYRAGLGLELELLTVTATLEQSHALADGLPLSFNVSPGLVVDPRLAHLLDDAGPRPLIIEITEHAVVEDYRRLIEALASFREQGIRLAIDDAGAGFASLRHIVRLEPDLIKLDASLTQDLGDDPVRKPLATALLQFAERTDSLIIVEGIESSSDLATWRELGAYAAQGYALVRPGSPPFPSEFGPLTGGSDRRTSSRGQGRATHDRRRTPR